MKQAPIIASTTKPRPSPFAVAVAVAVAGSGAATFCPGAAFANGMEDIFGLSARVKGMGGAGVAVSKDFASVYYNPARLTECPDTDLAVSYGHIGYGLEVTSRAGDPQADELPDRDFYSVGLCSQLPLGFSFGFHFSQNLQEPMRLHHQSIDAVPRFVMYGKRLDSLSIMIGPAYSILDNLAIGAAASVLAASILTVNNTVPVVVDAEVENEYGWDLSPKAAGYLGLFWAPTEDLELGVTYRSALHHRLNSDTETKVNLSGAQVELVMLLQSVSWYSPQQVAFGAAYALLDGLRVTAEITWYDWSGYPGPFIVGTPGPDSAIGRTLPFPASEAIAFNDTFVPRAGAEYVFFEDLITGRLGYSYRPTPAPEPDGRANLLDADTHTFSVGAGLRYGLGQRRDSESEVFVRMDAYGSYFWMQNRSVDKAGVQPVLNAYSFGGSVFDAGLTMAAEF